MPMHSPLPLSSPRPWFALCGFLLSLNSSAAIDYRQHQEGRSAVPAYEVPYVVPEAAGVKAVLDRIKEQVQRGSTFKVFDNKRGVEITDVSLVNTDCVIDRRLGSLCTWDYTNGVTISGFDLIAEVTGDSSYLEHSVRFYDFIFKWMPAFRELQVRTGKKNDFSKMVNMEALDHCGSISSALIKTQRRHPDSRYRAWIDVVADYISNKQFRLPDGTLARQRPQTASLWTDDFYMSIPFLTQMGVLTGERRYFDDAVRQVLQLSERLFNPAKGLYDHGWSVDAHPYDPRYYWGRANGWAAMAMAELLTHLPKDHPGREQVLQYFRSHVRSIAELQDGSGLWHNMLDRDGTYLETSASAMFVFAVARGINEGWIHPLYGPVAITGWNALEKKVLPDGRVEGICEGTTYANDAVYYHYRGAGSDTTFFGSVLYAGAEVIRLLNNPKLSITRPVPNAVNSAIHVRPK